MEAVEDPAGGNNCALAQKIAAEYPGMQPYISIGGEVKPSLPSFVCASENACNY